jgi:hypothetical protein
MRGSPFADYLVRGERVLWSGGPAQGVLLMPHDLFLVPFSLVWAGMPTMVFVTTVRDGGFQSFDWFLLIFVVVGFYMSIGRFVVDGLLRADSYYAVTDRRALQARRGLFPIFRSIDLDRTSDIQLRKRLGGRGTIIFGGTAEWSWWWHGRGYGHWSPALDPRAQFLAIRNPEKVYALLTDR